MDALHVRRYCLLDEKYPPAYRKTVTITRQQNVLLLPFVILALNLQFSFKNQALLSFRHTAQSREYQRPLNEMIQTSSLSISSLMRNSYQGAEKTSCHVNLKLLPSTWCGRQGSRRKQPSVADISAYSNSFWKTSTPSIYPISSMPLSLQV